jgi:hypothetical protein
MENHTWRWWCYGCEKSGVMDGKLHPGPSCKRCIGMTQNPYYHWDMMREYGRAWGKDKDYAPWYKDESETTNDNS